MSNRLRTEFNMKNRCKRCGGYPCRCPKFEGPAPTAEQVRQAEKEFKETMTDLAGLAMTLFKK